MKHTQEHCTSGPPGRRGHIRRHQPNFVRCLLGLRRFFGTKVKAVTMVRFVIRGVARIQWSPEYVPSGKQASLVLSLLNSLRRSFSPQGLRVTSIHNDGSTQLPIRSMYLSSVRSPRSARLSSGKFEKWRERRVEVDSSTTSSSALVLAPVFADLYTTWFRKTAAIHTLLSLTLAMGGCLQEAPTHTHAHREREREIEIPPPPPPPQKKKGGGGKEKGEQKNKS